MKRNLELLIACAEYVKQNYNGKDKEQVKAEMDEKIKQYKKEQEQGK